jgi:hypothetical protein
LAEYGLSANDHHDGAVLLSNYRMSMHDRLVVLQRNVAEKR